MLQANVEIIEVYKTICIMMDGNFISRKRIGGIVALILFTVWKSLGTRASEHSYDIGR